MAKEVTNKHNYRLKLNFTNALLIAIPYLAILLYMQHVSGVSLTEVPDTAENVRDFITIPVAVASAYLALVGFTTGWIQNVWRENNPLKSPSWLKWFTYILFTIILVNFASGNILSNDGEIIFYALLGTMLVGFSEEIMWRGYLLQGARESGFSEKKVAFTTSLAFGLVHGINILTGETVSTILPQIANAFIFGIVLYFIFRNRGSLLFLMLVHFLWDFALFTKGEVNETDSRAYIGVLMYPLIIVSAILVIRAWKYLDTKAT